MQQQRRITPLFLGGLILLTNLAHGAEWVGNQSDCQQTGPGASFHHGIYWENFQVPGANDSVILRNTDFGTTRRIHLGDFDTAFDLGLPCDARVIPGHNS